MTRTTQRGARFGPYASPQPHLHVLFQHEENAPMKASLRPWPLISRISAAVLGGYVFTYCCTAALARLLPLAKADAVVVATLTAFIIYTAVILWAFGCRSPWRAWGVLALAAPLAVIGFWPQLVGRLG